jgi:hypothetical protein
VDEGETGNPGTTMAESWMHLFCPTASADLSLCIRQSAQPTASTAGDELMLNGAAKAQCNNGSGSSGSIAICMISERIQVRIANGNEMCAN